MTSRRLFTLIASLLISAVFLAIALSSVNLAGLVQSFGSADYRFVALATVLTLLGYVLRAARWRQFLAPSKKIALGRVFPVMVIGFALNNLLPGRPGEFARAYSLGQREGLSKTLGLATVVVERVMDGLALIVFLVLSLGAFVALRMELPAAAEQIAFVAALLFGVALAGLFFLLRREETALRIARRVTRFLPASLATRVERMLASFVLGLHSLRSTTDFVVIVLLSLAVWASEAAAYWCVLGAFGALAAWPARVVAAAFVMVLINLGVMIPAAPGGLGPFEAAAVFALGFFGLGETASAGVALAAHGMQYVLVTGLGLVFIWREGLSLAQASAASQANE